MQPAIVVHSPSRSDATVAIHRAFVGFYAHQLRRERWEGWNAFQQGTRRARAVVRTLPDWCPTPQATYEGGDELVLTWGTPEGDWLRLCFHGGFADFTWRRDDRLSHEQTSGRIEWVPDHDRVLPSILRFMLAEMYQSADDT